MATTTTTIHTISRADDWRLGAKSRDPLSTHNNKWHVYSNQKNVKSAVSALSSTSSSFGTAAASTRFDAHTNGIDDAVKAQALAEEEAVMNQYRVRIPIRSPLIENLVLHISLFFSSFLPDQSWFTDRRSRCSH